MERNIRYHLKQYLVCQKSCDMECQRCFSTDLNKHIVLGDGSVGNVLDTHM